MAFQNKLSSFSNPPIYNILAVAKVD